MSSKTRASLLSLTVIVVLIFSAIGPTIVYADDGAPPDSSAETSVREKDSDKCKSEKQARESDDDDDRDEDDSRKCKQDKKSDKKNRDDKQNEGDHSSDAAGSGGNEQASEEPAGGSDPAPESGEPQPAVDETAAPAAESILSEVPADTTVTVLDADGEPQPLATQEAAEAIATTTDPIWCPQAPAGQPPTPPIPGANGCTPSFSSFTDLLTFLAANPTSYQGAGTIYVEQGAYGGGESTIDFNAFNLSNISNADLTVQGGWNTTTNTVDPGSTSTFTVPIIIGSSTNPWGGSLTIDSLVITGASQTGLTLFAQNNIAVLNVESTDSVNGAGAELDAGGNVTINNSKFLRNNTRGATITAGGNVAVANSEFSNTFNQRRQIRGLDVVSNGSVALFNVLAIGNRRAGVDINAQGRVTIGSSVFSETNGLNGGVFYGYGLRVVTPDAIDLANVTANNNFLWGADLDAGGDVAIADSVFNANSTESPTFIDDTGLLVTSGGRVSLNNVEANGNRLIGAVIEAVGDVSINNSRFMDNKGITLDAAGMPLYHGLGLQVVTLGNIFLNGVNASNNTLFGAHLEAGGDVTVSSSNFDNQTSGSATDRTGTGLEVISGGTVILDTVSVSNNQLFGASVQAASALFLDTVTATNNGDDGVQVELASCTHLIGGTYSGNSQYGLNLINSPLNVISPATFGGNGAGDIFPAIPATCSLALGSGVGGTTTANNNSRAVSSLGAGSSSLLQAVSYARGDSTATLAPLNSLLYSITRETIPGGIVTSIFAGRYIYVYTRFEDDSAIDNLQIMINPNWQPAVAVVGA